MRHLHQAEAVEAEVVPLVVAHAADPTVLRDVARAPGDRGEPSKGEAHTHEPAAGAAVVGEGRMRLHPRAPGRHLEGEAIDGFSGAGDRESVRDLSNLGRRLCPRVDAEQRIGVGFVERRTGRVEGWRGRCRAVQAVVRPGVGGGDEAHREHDEHQPEDGPQATVRNYGIRHPRARNARANGGLASSTVGFRPVQPARSKARRHRSVNTFSARAAGIGSDLTVHIQRHTKMRNKVDHFQTYVGEQKETNKDHVAIQQAPRLCPLLRSSASCDLA